MKNYDETIELKCRFCGTVCGTFQRFFYQKPLETEDVRCDACTLLYGTFKEMETKAEQDLGLSYDGFKDLMVKCEYKKPLFKKEFSKIKTDKIEGFKKLPKKERDEIISKLENF